MKRFWKFAGAGLALLANTSLAWAQSATLLPNALQYFMDANGKPLANGNVYFYVPGTTTPSTVWTSSAESTPQEQPVPLGISGHPASPIYGSGCYRQIVQDQFSNTIWDFPTCSVGTGGGGTNGVIAGDGLAVGTIVSWAGTTLPANYLWAAGQQVSRATYSQLLVAITYNATVLCQSGANTLTVPTSVSDGTPINAPIESSCFAAGTIVTAKSSGQLTLSNNANVTSSSSLIVFPWGNGNGSNTFTLPDLRGRVLAGRDNMNSSVAGTLTSTYYGVNPDALGALGGNQSHTLALTEIPGGIVSSANNSISVSGTVSVGSGSTTVVQQSSGNFGGSFNQTGGFGIGFTTFPTISSIGSTGSNSMSGTNNITVTSTNTSGGAHSIVQPTVTSDYIIKAIPNSTIPYVLGFNVLPTSTFATAAILPNSPTYNNGTAGVGATLTAGSNSTLTVDGVVAALNAVVLVNNQTTATQNGIYTVTSAGSGSTPWVLTRASYFNSPTTMLSGSYTYITSGATNIGTAWVLSQTTTTVGTNNVNFVLFSGNLAGSLSDNTTPYTGGTPYGLIYNNNGLVASTNSVNNGVVTTGAGGIPAVSARLPMAAGGCNASLTASNGGVLWSNATQCQILAGTATANAPLLSGAIGSPSWASITYPASATSGGLAYFSSATVMASSAVMTANAFMTGGGAGNAPNVVAITGLVLGNGASAPTAYGGATCTNQFIRALSALGGATCNTVSLTTDVSGTLPIANGGSGQTTAAAARSSSGFNIDELTSTGDANYTILATDRAVTHTTLTAARTDTLPAANSVNTGQSVFISDFRGVASASNTITVTRAGSDTVNGGTAFVAINVIYGVAECASDGISRWTCAQLGGSGGGGGSTSVTIAPGANISVSGTCSSSTAVNCTITSTLAASTLTGNTNTYAAAQAGKLVQRSNSGTVMVDTLPGTSPGVLAAGTAFTIANTDTSAILAIGVGSGAAMKANVASTGYVYLCPGQSIGWFSDGTNYTAVNQPATCYLKAATTFYGAASGGSATNTGLTSSSPLADCQSTYAMVQSAFNLSYLNPASQSVTFQCGTPGTSGQTFALQAFTDALPGQGLTETQFGIFPVIIQGDTTTPANIVVTTAVTNAPGAIQAYGSASFLLQGFQVYTTGSAQSAVFVWGAQIAYKSMDFDGAVVHDLVATHAGYIEVAGSYTIHSGFGHNGSHWFVSDRSSIYVQANSTITISGTPTYPSGLVGAQYAGSNWINNATLTFAGTGISGTKCAVNTPSYLGGVSSLTVGSASTGNNCN